MLILFHSKAAAEVLMLGEHALPILRAAGRVTGDTLPERGVITRADLAAAIAGIEGAVALDPVQNEDEERDDEEPVHPISRPVSLSQRAYPLLAMLRAAQAGDADVTWEPAPRW